MSTQAVQPVRRISLQSIFLALAGAVLAVAAGFGIAMLVLDDAVTTAPTTVDVDQGPLAGSSDFEKAQEDLARARLAGAR